MKYALVCFLLLSSVLSLSIDGTFNFNLSFEVSGSGQGTLDVLEYPRSFSDQLAECSSTHLQFPPNNLFLNCQVLRFIKHDMNYSQYSGGNLTQASDEMKNLAVSLTAHKLTSFDKAVELVKWVRVNVQYDLGKGDTQESAIWTYEHKIGTCDELSHLFIALARSAGLQARYVAGYAYTGEKWLPHAWAEVWTQNGWTPFDIAFDEYGYVDPTHIAVYRGVDGAHNFINLKYTGDVSVNNDFVVKTVNLTKRDLIQGGNLLVGKGGQYLLVNLSVNNPYPNSLLVFPQLMQIKNFDMNLVEDSLIIPPGENYLLIPVKLPKIKEGYVYTIPFTLYIGSENFTSTFKISENSDCSPLEEVSPYHYDVSNCIGFKGREKVATSGKFFCKGCFYSLKEPTTRTYEINYPEFCLDNCTVAIRIVGNGPYHFNLNGEFFGGTVNVYKDLKLPVKLGENSLTFEGEKHIFVVKSPPKINLKQVPSRNGLCFNSNWDVSPKCVDLACGENTFELNLTYGNLYKSRKISFTRECNFFERLIELFRKLIS